MIITYYNKYRKNTVIKISDNNISVEKTKYIEKRIG